MKYFPPTTVVCACDIGRKVFQDFRVPRREQRREREVCDELLMASNWKPTKRSSNLFASVLFLVTITPPECFTMGANEWNTYVIFTYYT